ncbi:MAG TPA: EB domain-containing protein, partial [bacterium]|nr:EB domain-containing protein [bacterium]
MNLSSFRLYAVALMFVLVSVFTGCSGNKTCSADTQCKDGSYCNDGKCTEFKNDDYKLVFESPSDKATVTSAQDLDLSVEGIQIDVNVAMEDAKSYINDGMSVVLSVKKGSNEVLLTGKFIKGKAVFSQVTLPEGEVTLSAYLEQNPAVKSIITVNSLKMDVTMYYLKGGAEGAKTLLESSVITDEDDSDGSLENGIQLNLVAETAGMKEGDVVNLFFPQISEDDKAGEGSIDDNGTVVFENITVPVLANVTMTIVSGEYSENVEFEVSSKIFCGFLINIKDDKLFGKKDDRNDTLSGLQFDLVISEITGCGKGSKVSIFIDSDETGDPQTSFTISADQVEERITLQKSTSSEDKRSVLVVVEDESKNMKGTKTAEGIIVDLDDPSVDISFPEVGAELNMTDDIDAETPGLQVNFEGSASDVLTGPVLVEFKLGETVVSSLKDINGDFESLYTFPQSLPTAVLTVTVFDNAGNSSDTVTPFSVNIDPGIEFYSVCGNTGADIIDAMWLNLSDDSDEETELLQCKVIIRIGDGTGATHLSLKAGYGEEVKKEIESDNTVEFDISLADSIAGITLNAKSYIEESLTGENNLTVRVDTELPVVTLGNSLLLGNGGTTGSENITFEYHCTSEFICTFNALLDDETSTAFVTDTERVLSGLSSGAHSFKVKARDAAGNEGSQTVFNWTIESEKPETTITSDPGAGTTSNFALFTFTSSITPATFHCRLQKDGINFMPADGTWEECNSGSRNYYGLAEGTYRFQVYAEDGAGNTDPSPAEHEWVIGSAAPVTTITKITPSISPVNLNSIEFEFEATVESTYECRLEKSGVIVENWSDCSIKTKSYATLADGSYIFKVRATALYGVEENTPATYSWKIDTTAPKIRFTSKPALESPYDSGTFSFECVDASTPCVYECELDTAVVDCSAGSYSYSSLAGGSHNFKVTATDAAGNVSISVSDTADEFVNDYTWMIDDTVLGVQITAKPDPATTSDSAAFEFSSNKVATFECKIDTGAFEVCTTPKNYTTLSDGTHTFTVKAVFGADEAFESYSWIIDNTNPVVTIELGPDNPTFQTNAIFNFSADETALFECKFSTDTEWSSCTSPKLYPAGTFGVLGTEQTYTFEVRATDLAGNQGTASHTWVVDLNGPAIEWISPAPGTDGKVLVGKAQDVYSSDPSIYAINVVLKVSGSNPGQPINITGFKTPPGYNIISVDTTSPKNYTLTVGLQDGARINNPLTITVEDNTGSVATLNQLVIVNTEMPTITWAYPVNNHKFIANTTDPQFIFNVWNAVAGMDVELVNSNTDEVVATRQTVGSSSAYQEYVTFNPAITDKCGTYSFYARLYDPVDEITHYTNAVTDDLLKSSRAVTVDRDKAVIGDITIPGLSDIDRILNRDDNMNPDIDGGMQIDVTVNITDAENSSDSNRTVKLFTNNGIGSDASILLATLYNQG